MKVFQIAAITSMIALFSAQTFASTATCTTDKVNVCKTVRVLVSQDGAGCSAEVEFDKVIIKHKNKHTVTFVLEKTSPTDKSVYVFDQNLGINILEDAAKQVESKVRGNDKAKFTVVNSNNTAALYKIAYIAAVKREGANAVACAAVDPTIENQ